MTWILKDLVFGLRGIRKAPGFALLAILTLALGIGAATTIFSAIHNILLYPFPYKDADRVVAVQIIIQKISASKSSVGSTASSARSAKRFIQSPPQWVCCC